MQGFGFAQLADHLLVDSASLEKGSLPEFGGNDPVARVAGKPQEEGIHVQNLAAGGIDDYNAVGSRLEKPPVAGFGRLLALGDIEQRQQHAFDVILRRPVWPDPQRVRTAVGILHFTLSRSEVVEHLLAERGHIRHIDLQPQIAHRPAHVGSQKVEQLLGLRGEPPDAQIAAQHENGDTDGAEEIEQVVVDLLKFGVAALHLLVDRGQFFVGGLEFFLGGQQFLVGAL